MQVQTWPCVHSRTFFVSKSYAAVRNSISNTLNLAKTTIHRLATQFRGTRSVRVVGIRFKWNILYIIILTSPHTSVRIETRLRAGRPEFDSRQVRISLIVTALSRTALGPTLPPTQKVPGLLARGLSDRGVELTTHSHLVLRL